MSKLPSGNGILVASPADAVMRRRGLHLAASAMAAAMARDLLQFGVVHVERDHFGARGGAASNACRPAPHPRSSSLVPGLDGQPGEVHGQHGVTTSAVACAVPDARLAAIASRYSATVALATACQANRSATLASGGLREPFALGRRVVQRCAGPRTVPRRRRASPASPRRR